MIISIRESTTDQGCIALHVYRPRERAFSLPGSAYQTKSSYWIVYVPGQTADVVKTKAEAILRLNRFYAAQSSVNA